MITDRLAQHQDTGPGSSPPCCPSCGLGSRPGQRRPEGRQSAGCLGCRLQCTAPGGRTRPCRTACSRCARWSPPAAGRPASAAHGAVQHVPGALVGHPLHQDGNWNVATGSPCMSPGRMNAMHLLQVHSLAESCTRTKQCTGVHSLWTLDSWCSAIHALVHGKPTHYNNRHQTLSLESGSQITAMHVVVQPLAL